MTKSEQVHKQILECLAEAVAEEFERKYRLGYSAVIWRDGKCVEISGEELLGDSADTPGSK